MDNEVRNQPKLRHFSVESNNVTNLIRFCSMCKAMLLSNFPHGIGI